MSYDYATDNGTTDDLDYVYYPETGNTSTLQISGSIDAAAASLQLGTDRDETQVIEMGSQDVTTTIYGTVTLVHAVNASAIAVANNLTVGGKTTLTNASATIMDVGALGAGALQVNGLTTCAGQLFVGADNQTDTTGQVGGVITLGGTYGDSSAHSKIFTRLYGAGYEKSEMVVYKGNDTVNTSGVGSGSKGPDRIRLRTPHVLFDARGDDNYTNETTVMTVNASGVWIGKAPDTDYDIPGFLYVTGNCSLQNISSTNVQATALQATNLSSTTLQTATLQVTGQTLLQNTSITSLTVTGNASIKNVSVSVLDATTLTTTQIKLLGLGSTILEGPLDVTGFSKLTNVSMTSLVVANSSMENVSIRNAQATSLLATTLTASTFVATNSSLENVSVSRLQVSSLSVRGNASLGNVSIQGNMTNTGYMIVSGQTTLVNASVTGNLSAGNASLWNVSVQSLTTGPLWATSTTLQNVSADSLVVLGNTSLNNVSASGLTVIGRSWMGPTSFANASITGTFAVAGNTSLQNVSILGNTTQGYLSVVGATSLANASISGTLAVAGNVSMNNVSVYGTLATNTITSFVQSDNLTIGGDQITGMVLIGLNSQRTGDINIGNNMQSGVIKIGNNFGTNSASFQLGTTNKGISYIRGKRINICDDGGDIFTNALIGIGEGTPVYPIHISTSRSPNYSSAKIWSIGDNVGTAYGGFPAVSVYCSNDILTKGKFIVESDRRIKTNIVDIEDDRALQDLRRLKPKTYTYKDVLTRGTDPVYGFIAQEVKEVLNHASYPMTETIPNIYELVTFSGTIMTMTFNTSDLSRDASGALFTRIKVRTRGEKDEYVHIVDVLDEHTLRVDKDLSAWGGQLDGESVIPGNQIFVYGQEVNDFHNLNKDAIWTVATAALQEVDRQLQAEKAKTAELQSTIASMLTRLDALEQK